MTDEAMDLEAWLLSFAVSAPPRGREALDLSHALVNALGDPQRSAPAVHIVGTAGKGSVASLLTDRLVASGLRVATHQSPHVDDIRERFLLDGAFADESTISAAVAEMTVAIGRVRTDTGRAPSFFAVTAAMSWVIGRAAGADLFVTEAGIGGRLDATAALDRPDTLTVITNIGLDHQEVLGATCEAIAAEKAAVMRGRRVAVLGPQTDDGAAEVVRAAAADAAVVLHEVAAGRTWREDAVATAEVAAGLIGEMFAVPVAHVEPVFPAGRGEHISGADREWILDGAHNPLKLHALATSREDPPSVVIAAIGSGKDLVECGRALARFDAPVIATQFATAAGPASWSAAALADAVRAAPGSLNLAPDAVSDINAAVAAAHRRTQPGDTIVVTGSFIVLAEARAAITATARSSGQYRSLPVTRRLDLVEREGVEARDVESSEVAGQRVDE